MQPLTLDARQRSRSDTCAGLPRSSPRLRYGGAFAPPSLGHAISGGLPVDADEQDTAEHSVQLISMQELLSLERDKPQIPSGALCPSVRRRKASRLRRSGYVYGEFQKPFGKSQHLVWPTQPSTQPQSAYVWRKLSRQPGAGTCCAWPVDISWL